MKTLNGITFLETKDIKKALQIGNKTCLDLFNKKDFPGKKIGKSWLVMEDAFKDYFKFQQNTNITKIRRFKYATFKPSKILNWKKTIAISFPNCYNYNIKSKYSNSFP